MNATKYAPQVGDYVYTTLAQYPGKIVRVMAHADAYKGQRFVVHFPVTGIVNVARFEIIRKA